MSEDIRIVIAEDHHLFREGLRRALETEHGLHVVAEASDGLMAFSQIESLRPDVAIVDVGMAGLDGMAVVRKVRRENLPVEIIFLTVCSDEEMFEAALEWGVKGYLLKDCTAAEVVRCVQTVAAGQHYTSSWVTTYLVQKLQRIDRFASKTPGLDLLTPQERTILRRIAQGKTSKEIAEEMVISPKTVDAHRLNICNKLDIHGNHVLSRFAFQHREEI